MGKRILVALLGALAVLSVSDAAMAGRKTQEPPPPSRPGNPFPRNPDKPLHNPLHDERKNLNPRNDPDVQRGIQKQYQEHWKNRR
jgi:hypothetical protein